MFSINVPLPQWIISQVIALFILGIAFYGFQASTKRRSLVAFSIGSLLWVANAVLIENYVIAGIFGAAFLRNIALLWLDKRGDKVSSRTSFIILIVCLIPAIIVTILTWIWWLDWVILGANVFKIYGMWRAGIHWFRLTNIPFVILVLINHIFFVNIVGVIIEIVVIGSTIMFYVRWNKKRKQELQKDVTIEHELRDGVQETGQITL